MLEVQDLGVLVKRDGHYLISDVSFQLEKGECLGIVGESGSGKSTVIKSIFRLHNSKAIGYEGKALYKGEDLFSKTPKEMAVFRGREMFMVFQDGMSAFDPSVKMGNLCTEIVCSHLPLSKEEAREKLCECMSRVSLRDPVNILELFPFQLSGGMLQRMMISLVLMLNPSVIMADEPTSALDAITQRKVLEDFIHLKKDHDSAMIFISHDLGIVKKLCDRVMVMKDGKVVEMGSSMEIFNAPKHEYTKYLIDTRVRLSQNFKVLMEGLYKENHNDRDQKRYQVL